jgi:hypothetical protein
MRKSILSVLAACGVVAVIAFSSAPAYAKTVKECDAEYAANKDTIKASGQKKADYVAACRAGSAVPVATPAVAAPAVAAPAAPAVAPAATPTVAAAKTVKECDAEYAANKAAIKASGQKKADYVAACRAGAAAPVAAPAAAAPAAPAPAAAPAATPAAAAPPPVAPAAAPAKPRVAAPAAAGGFAADTQAKAHCPADTVVWVNTKSGVYHFAGTHNYGTTRQGAYMCEADAKAAGDRAAENEKHP